MLLHIFLYAFLNKVWECFCILRVELFFGYSRKSCCPSLFGMKLAGSGLLDTSYPTGWNWDSLGSWDTVERKVTF